MTYEEWENAVSDHIDSIVGCTLLDLPDCDTRAMFDADVGVEEAALEVLALAGYEPEVPEAYRRPTEEVKTTVL